MVIFILFFSLSMNAFFPYHKLIGVRAIFCQGVRWTIRPKILASCPNLYEAVEKKRGSYDALTKAYIWSENILTYESIIWARKTC